ncbi:MAG: peptidoglycan DD-metalloendopeptidase family protein [Gemmatimonadota bacterium]
MPLWAFRAGLLGAAVVSIALLLGAALYVPIVRTAARVPGLRRDISRLETENVKIRQLVAALDTAENRYAQIRQMLGGDVVPDPVTLSASLPIAPPLRAHDPATQSRYETGPSIPHHWPLDEPGYVTQGQVGTGTRDEAHPGVDIAVPMGSIVRASGGATVLQTGEDPEYGSFVLLQHPDGYQTMYGHLSRSAVSPNAIVQAGEVIGLSGNSGRSSAPHLHFEIRLEGRSLDPLTLVKEGS